MIETIMCIAIGLLLGCLVGLMVIPLVHNRAVQLTFRRLEATVPHTIEEIQADKDLLRAEFAMSTRRFEITIEQVKKRTPACLCNWARGTRLSIV